MFDVRGLRSHSLVTGYWLLVTGYWLLVTGYWLLVTGYWGTQITNEQINRSIFS